jgi:hypothetical protein
VVFTNKKHVLKPGNKIQQTFTALHWSSPYVRKLVIRNPTEPHLTTRQQKAFEFLCDHELFKKLSRNILMKLIRQVGILTLEKTDNKPIYLYERGKPERHMILVLEGKVEVTKGALLEESKQQQQQQQTESKSKTESEQLTSVSQSTTKDKDKEVSKEHKHRTKKKGTTEKKHHHTSSSLEYSTSNNVQSPSISKKDPNPPHSNEVKMTKEELTTQNTCEEWETVTGPVILGSEALTGPEDFFIPKFTVRVVGKVHIVKISRVLYEASIKATQLEKELHEEVIFLSLSLSFFQREKNLFLFVIRIYLFFS